MEDNIYGGGYYAKPHDANPGAYLDVYNPQGQVITPEQFKSTGLNVTQLPSAPQNIPTTDVSLGNPTITSDMLKTPTTSFDIQGLLRENQKIREKYLSSLTPSSQEQDLGVQIADIQNKIRQQDLSFQRGSEDIAQQRISMPLITGQQAALGRQAQLEQQQLSIQESNLLTRLGLAQEARTAQQKVLETGMSFIAQDIELQGKIQDRISAEQDRILQRAATMSTLQKNTLSQLAQAFQAYTPEQLVQFQPQIAQIASQAGIPIDLALATIHSASDEYAFGKLSEGLDIQKKQAELAALPLDQKYKQAQIANIYSQIKDREKGASTEQTDFIASILAEPSLFNSLTPSKKTELLPTLTKYGFKPVQNLTSKVAEGFSDMDGVRGIVDRVDNLLKEGVSTGPLSAGFGSIQRFFGFEDPRQLSFKNLTEDMFRTILKATSGVAASEREVERLRSFLPTFSKQEGVNKQSLIDFKQTLQEVEFNAIKRYAQQNFDVSNQLRDLDARLLSSIAGIDISGVQLDQGEGVAMNRQTGDIMAITQDEYNKDPMKYLILE